MKEQEKEQEKNELSKTIDDSKLAKQTKSRGIKLKVNSKCTSYSTQLRRYFNFKKVNEDFLLKHFNDSYNDPSYCNEFIDALNEPEIPQWAVEEFYKYFFIDEKFIKTKYLNPSYKRLFEDNKGD